MARACTSGARMENTSAALAVTYPCSLAIWCKPGVHLGSTFWGFGTTAGSPNNHWLVLAYDGGNRGFFELAVAGAGNDALGPAGTLFTDGAWNLAVGVCTSLTSRIMYVNGVAGTADTGSAAINAFTNTTICGAYFGSGTIGAQCTADLAMATVWNVALTAGDVTNLWNGGSGGNGTHPRNVRGQSVLGFYEITGSDSPELDTVGTRNMTLVGSPGQVAGPPVDPFVPDVNTKSFQAIPI